MKQLIALLLLSAGCTGAISDDAPAGPADQAPRSAPSNGGRGAPVSTSTTPSPGSSGSTACAGPVLPVGVRRLTDAEYRATVRDLFPGIALPPTDLAQEIDASGFENRSRIMNPTALLVEQQNSAAVAIAAQAVKNLNALLPCAPTPATEGACAAQFVDTFGARALRRPLTDAEKKSYGDFFNQQRAALSFQAAVQLTVEAFLQAPAFLYRVELGDPATAGGGRVRRTAFELAARLSYLLWGTMPDQTLADAARTGHLTTPADIEAQARRMVKDGRLRGMMLDFHRQWLELDRIQRETTKDAKLYPTYGPALQAAMREESDRLVDAVMVKGDGTLRTLLTSNATFVDASLARTYGVPAPASGWTAASLDPVARAGFLTRANFLASHAHLQTGSPPLRAVFIMRRLLCTAPPPPPPDANTTPPAQATTSGAKTNRQLFEERTVGACQACHSSIDPLGFGLENYDAIGGFRTTDNGLPVNATGEIKNADVSGAFTGGVELSRRLADSAQVRLCMTGQWYEYALGRDRTASDECKIRALDEALAAAGGDVRQLLVALTRMPELTHRSAP